MPPGVEWLDAPRFVDGVVVWGVDVVVIVAGGAVVGVLAGLADEGRVVLVVDDSRLDDTDSAAVDVVIEGSG